MNVTGGYSAKSHVNGEPHRPLDCVRPPISSMYAQVCLQALIGSGGSLACQRVHGGSTQVGVPVAPANGVFPDQALIDC